MWKTVGPKELTLDPILTLDARPQMFHLHLRLAYLNMPPTPPSSKPAARPPWSPPGSQIVGEVGRNLLSGVACPFLPSLELPFPTQS